MLSKVYKAYDIRGVYPDPLSEEIGWKTGFATGKFLKSKLSGPDASDPMLRHVVVGRDMRPSSPQMAQALIDGILASGMSVFDVGMVDTSFIYFAINHLGCAGGVQTTASHNPIEYNGYKISGRYATPIGAETGLVDIQRLAATAAPCKAGDDVRHEERDLWDDYIAHVRKFMDIKRPVKVAVDASNGMAGAFLPRIFEGVKNLEMIPINFEITGKFNHDPNPLVPENMVPTQQAVLEHGADFGVCFDGDADRCILCDEKGQLVGCDLLGAIFAEHFLASSPRSAIVFDLRSSKALKEAVEKAGGTAIRSRVGHVFMKKLMREHEGVFGAELSGHMYYRDNYFTDSGAITFATALSIVSAASKPLSQLIAPVAHYAQSGEINFRVEDKDAVLGELKQRYSDGKIDELDGVTIDLFEKQGWWVNVRASNTEPLLRLNLEGRDDETVRRQLDEITPMVGEPAVGH